MSATDLGATRPDDSLSEKLRSRFRAGRMVLFGQAMLILAYAASLPYQVSMLLSRPNSLFRASSDLGREFMSASLSLGAVVIGCLYVALAILTLTAAWKMRERSRWGWHLAMTAGISGFTLACMPFGLYAVWVLSNPAVRDAMGKQHVSH